MQRIFPIAACANDIRVMTACANAIPKMVTTKDVGWLTATLLDGSLGDIRSMLIPAFARVAGKGSMGTLRRLVGDPEMRSYALQQLSKLGDTTIEPELLELAKHRDSYHRKISRDALKRLEKNNAKAQTASRH